MTGDELVEAIAKERGYVVLASYDPAPIGFIVKGEQVKDSHPHTIPLRIISATTANDFELQRALSESLAPGSTTTRRGAFFYRCEAAD